MKHRILWHLPYSRVGGAETSCASLLSVMDDTKYEHHLSYHNDIHNWVTQKFHKSVKLWPYNSIETLIKNLNAVAPRVIMGTHGKLLFQALSEMVNPQSVIEIVHGANDWQEYNARTPKTWTKHVICVSQSAEKRFKSLCDIDIPTSVIVNGVDLKTFYPRNEISVEPKVIAYLGRFSDADKKITKMLQAFSVLKSPKTRFHMIGGNPHELEVIQKTLKTLKLENEVKVFGFSLNPELYYKSIDVVTVRSEAEGYCNTVAESLASGVPCVCFNFGGILDHVPQGTVLVANTQQEYASMMRKCFEDYPLRLDMREKGLEYARTLGSLTLMAKKYDEVIQDVIYTIPKVVKNKTQSEDIDIPFVGIVKQVHSRPIVGVCNFNWHGIYTSTKHCTDIQINWQEDSYALAEKIIRSQPRAVLFSGMCEGFDKAALIVKRRIPQVPIYGFYHGGYSHYSFAPMSYGEIERVAFEKMIKLLNTGIFHKIACAYPGMEEVAKARGLRFEFCGNAFDVPTLKNASCPLPTGVHIGNWNRPSPYKHTTIAMAAAQLIEDSYVHIVGKNIDVPTIDYSRVVNHGEMPQKTLYEWYAKMHVNIQVSFIETFNISVMEMWAAGTPVIIGPGNYVLIKDNDFLKETCLVIDHTNPVALADKIKEVVLNKDLRNRIIIEQFARLETINMESKERWRRFFE